MIHLHGTQQIDEKGVLHIGGLSVSQLAQVYGTPLYIMDEAHIRHQANTFIKTFTHPEIETEVIYAAKAFFTKAMAQVIHEEGLSLDVVSGGELYTAKSVNFPMRRVYFHGNNKTDQELKMAIEYGVGMIVLDHPEESKRLYHLLKHSKVKQSVMIRVNPGVEAHTHDFIKTTHIDSKFGMSLYDPQTLLWIKEVKESPHLVLKGLHVHIGSQIFEPKAYEESTKLVMEFVSKLNEHGISLDALNLGGGFGVYYTALDTPFDLYDFFPKWLEQLNHAFKKRGLPKMKILIEPGRAIVANAGTTLYTIGASKKTLSGKKYVFVDGSMADHLRTALYGSKYTALLPTRLLEKADTLYDVAGKACESGDVLVKDVLLPKVQNGDLLAVLSTGAYHYSMASNYNRLLKPPVVFVSMGQAKLVVKGESYEDLLRNDKELMAYEYN